MTRREYRTMLNQNDVARRERGELPWSNKAVGGDGSRNKTWGPRKRLYGDYLYLSDRDMFECSYIEHLKTLGLEHTYKQPNIKMYRRTA